ncbi:MAG: hypothetical protein HQL15_08040 [Candidatus Omnitrophica bacterium]|nr:hypothetical protein [Candidatus Omnitrophota bacterium]
MTTIILPELGEGITKATVAYWHVQQGDHVVAGDEVCEVTTDKATFNVEAPATGRVKSIAIQQGQDGLIGSVLGIIE